MFEDLYIRGKSLNMFDEDSALRQLLFKISISKLFERFIIVIILVSSVQLALTNNLNDPNGSF